jgi:hypothetical protein
MKFLQRLCQPRHLGWRFHPQGQTFKPDTRSNNLPLLELPMKKLIAALIASMFAVGAFAAETAASAPVAAAATASAPAKAAKKVHKAKKAKKAAAAASAAASK